MTPLRPSATRHRSIPTVTGLEARYLLSATAIHASAKVAHVHRLERLARARAAHKAAAANHHVSPTKLTNLVMLTDPVTGDPITSASSPVVGALNPTQVQTAYGVSLLGAANQGQGMTIGIVDEYHDPNILNDVNTFSAQYGLPQFTGTGGNPSFYDVLDTTFGSVPNSPHSTSTGTALETALDVEWAHAMAPKANIVLIEVPASGSLNNEFAELLHGVQLAAAGGGIAGSVSTTPGATAPVATVVSLSYGYTESGIGTSNVATLNNTYLATGAATNAVITVSTGDSAYPGFPGTSPNVIGVGGTSLYISTSRGKYNFETAWGGVSGAGAGGGGQSAVFSTPTYQTGNGLAYAHRAIPDVSLIADPITSASIYDSWSTSGGSTVYWTGIGGTSLASPVFAGIVSLAQQRRVASNLTPLTSATLDSAMYSLYNSSSYTTYFHDITLGTNQNVGSSTTYYSAITGYDLATGIGSPIASTLVPYLATL